MKSMPCKILSTIFILFSLAACTGGGDKDDSDIKTWDRDIFNSQAAKHNAIGWEKDKGGRSWTVEDEKNYDQWVNTVPSTLLKDWDIPTDCADAAMALRFVFAYINGLALKFAGYKSTSYYNKPITFLRKAVRDFGTINLHQISYKVDMWDKVNYEGGNFLLYRVKTTGHTTQLKSALNHKIFPTLVSTVPAQVRDLYEEYLFQTEVKNHYFRRFYAITRTESGLKYDEEISYEAHPPLDESKDDWYGCVSTYITTDKAPLWNNIYNYLSSLEDQPNYDTEAMAKADIKCPHNIAWKADILQDTTEDLEPPQHEELFDAMIESLCVALDKRSKAVIEGYEACYNTADTNTDKCDSSAAGLYSTPSRDFQFMATSSHFLGSLSRVNGGTFWESTCPIKPYPSNHPRAGETIDVNLFNSEKSYSFWISNFISQVTTDLEGDIAASVADSDSVSSPIASLSKRWGCAPDDEDLLCIQNRSFLSYADYLENYPNSIESLEGFTVGQKIKINHWSIKVHSTNERRCYLDQDIEMDIIAFNHNPKAKSALVEVLSESSDKDLCQKGEKVLMPLDHAQGI